MKKFLILVAAMGLLFSLNAKVWINEFCITPTSSEFMELYNDDSNDYSLDGHSLIEGGSSWAETLSLDGLNVPAGGYFVIDSSNVSGFGLPNEGGWMKIVDGAGNVLDSVAYGNQGPAPAAIYKWSSARVSYTGDLANDFNMDKDPTKGAANDAISPNLGSSNVIINEVKADTTTDKEQFIELYNNGSEAVDISNWIIICDDDYYIPSGTVLNPGEYFVLSESDFPPYFYMGANYENLYLFDNNMVRVDQVGWSLAEADSSFSVKPNGERSVYNGYSTETSTDFTWATPTKGESNDPSNGIDCTLNPESNVVVSVSNGGVVFSMKGLSGHEISLNIYDVSGRTVRSINYDLKGNTKMPVSLKQGIYFFKLTSGDKVFSGKFMVVK